MPARQTIAAADAPTTYALAQLLHGLAEQGRITPAQFCALSASVGGYVPAHVTMEQRTPKGALYVTVRTDDDVTHLSVSNRAAVQYS